MVNCWIYCLTQIFDLRMGYHQIKSEPTICNVALLVVDPSSIHHYILWSDQYYHIVHIMAEVQ